MKILIIGGGGREHALAWKISQDSSRPDIFCAPGNPGTAGLGANLDIDAEDLGGLLHWAVDEQPDLTVVGPEAPLCAGIVDRFNEAGLRVFGPTAACARLEGSKQFTKELMQAAGVPTAEAVTFTVSEEACAYVRERGAPIVIKADGLAAGKGVTVCRTIEEAERAIRESLEEDVFGDAGACILVEDFLKGEEASILGLVDGEHIVLLDSSQDHKPVFDGDQGPNTGGMGAYSPAPVISGDLWPVIREQVFERTVNELRKRGLLYKGVLYAGLMITGSGPKVVEFNCRFGDPECQAVLPRITSDLVPVLEACVDGTLSEATIEWSPRACTCVVMASGGYPGAYEKGKVITGIEQAGAMEEVNVFHAGTRDENGLVVTAGGRVLGVTALGNDLEHAVEQAYRAVSEITFEGAHVRTDIAHKVFAHA